MKLLKTILVEDDQEQINTTESFLKKYAEEYPEYSFDMHAYQSPIEFTETYKSDADLIFLDIRMPGLTGMEVARDIRKNDAHAILIFITSLAQYAIEGYSVQASDYLLKPITYPEFKLKLTKVLETYSPRNEFFFLFKTDEGMTRLNANDITYLESSIHTVIYHTVKGDEFKKHQSMKEAEEETKNLSSFFRINSGFIVNFAHVDALHNHMVVLKDGKELPISRARLKETSEAFLSYRP